MITIAFKPQFFRSPCGRSKSSHLDETNDCTVVATARALAISYDEAWDIMAKIGRQPKRGFHLSKNEHAKACVFESNGLICGFGQDCHEMVQDFINSHRFGTFICSAKIRHPDTGELMQHAFCIADDGWVYDFFATPETWIEMFWEIVPWPPKNEK